MCANPKFIEKKGDAGKIEKKRGRIRPYQQFKWTNPAIIPVINFLCPPCCSISCSGSVCFLQAKQDNLRPPYWDQ